MSGFVRAVARPKAYDTSSSGNLITLLTAVFLCLPQRTLLSDAPIGIVTIKRHARLRSANADGLGWRAIACRVVVAIESRVWTPIEPREPHRSGITRRGRYAADAVACPDRLYVQKLRTTPTRAPLHRAGAAALEGSMCRRGRRWSRLAHHLSPPLRVIQRLAEDLPTLPRQCAHMRCCSRALRSEDLHLRHGDRSTRCGRRTGTGKQPGEDAPGTIGSDIAANSTNCSLPRTRTNGGLSC